MPNLSAPPDQTMYRKQSADGYRSLPYKRPFLAAGFIAMIHYLALITAITLGYILVQEGQKKVTYAFIAAVIVLALSWLVGYFRRASAKCPLCKGTPLLDTQAAKHKKAHRAFPLNYGTTAQISMLMTHRFRCMYCGTGYDLLRKSSQNR